MTRKSQAEPRRAGRGGYAVLIAVIVLAALASTPFILNALHLRFDVGAPKTSHGVRLLPAPAALPAVALSSVATPIDAGQPAASLPTVKAASEAAAVAAEDARIRTMVHDSASVYQPEVVPVRGSLPTLVLTARSGPYTYADLVTYGALVLLPGNEALLLDNVFVSTNAHLDLGSAAVRTLYLDDSSSGFASIVAWGGSLSFQGTTQQPLTIMGWDRATKSPARDTGSGRPYIREVGGAMNLSNVRASALGFWSGRTGGVAWTGATGLPSTGGATSSTFTNDTYGAFVSRGRGLTFSDDLFEFNELDGLHIHRNTVGTSVSASSAVRNGGDGFLVDRATNGTVFRGVLSERNTGDGFLIDGRPLVTGASASGGSVAPDSGTFVEDSAVTGNGQTGILLEGGTGTVLRSNEVCASLTGVAIRDGASDTIVTGNDIRCGPRVALEIGTAAPGSLISGNALVNARIGILVRSSGPVQLDSNRITGAKVFGITARGDTSRVTGQGNVVSGTGFRAVDARADAGMPTLSGTDDAGWAHHAKSDFWSYLRFHPLALLWLSILVLVIGGEIWSRVRRPSSHPYPASLQRRNPPPAADPTRAPAEAHVGPAAGPAEAHVGSAAGPARGPAEAYAGSMFAGLKAGGPGRDLVPAHEGARPAAAARPANGYRPRAMTRLAGNQRAPGGVGWPDAGARPGNGGGRHPDRLGPPAEPPRNGHGGAPGASDDTGPLPRVDGP
jgi:hypothetical protein